MSVYLELLLDIPLCARGDVTWHGSLSMNTPHEVWGPNNAQLNYHTFLIFSCLHFHCQKFLSGYGPQFDWYKVCANLSRSQNTKSDAGILKHTRCVR
jgi:hypothetical protein